MTLVSFYLHMPPGSLPGIAVCATWPASASGPFQIHEFTLAYGGAEESPSHRFEPGNYWVQMKLHTGEIIRELVAIPEKKHASVHLRAGDTEADSGKLEKPSNDSFPPQLLDIGNAELSTQILLEHRVLVPRGAAMGLIVKGSAATPVAPRKRAWVPHHRRNYFVFPEIGDHRFSLTSLWTEPPYLQESQQMGGRKLETRLKPEDYFRGILLSRNRAAMVPTVEGNEVTTLIEGSVDNDLGDSRFGLTQAVRGYALLDGTGQRYHFLVGLPQLHRPHCAKLIVRTDRQDPQRRVKVLIQVDDPSFKSMLQFMNASDLGSAIRVAESSLPILYAKFDNPLAAVAAGYVLVQAPPQTVKVPWGQWIGNLGHYFPSLPDGKILHATLLLQRGDTASHDDYFGDHSAYFPADQQDCNVLAASLLIDSLLQGPPIFRAGLALLATNLRILASVQLPNETQSLLEAANKLVTWLSMRVDPRESFSIFRLEKTK